MTVSDVYRNGRFEADPWVLVADDAPIPADAPVIVSAARLAAGIGPTPAAARLGVLIGPADRIEDLAALVGRVSLAVVTFPKFNDGRGFSQARLLVERLHFDGEIRATGEVLLDQIPLMLRVGISAFKIDNAPTRAALQAGHLPTVRNHYQPASDAPVGSAPVAGRRFVGPV